MDRNNQIPRDVGAEQQCREPMAGSPGGTRLENKDASCPLCPNPGSAIGRIRPTILKPLAWFLFCSGLFSTGEMNER